MLTICQMSLLPLNILILYVYASAFQQPAPFLYAATSEIQWWFLNSDSDDPQMNFLLHFLVMSPLGTLIYVSETS